MTTDVLQKKTSTQTNRKIGKSMGGQVLQRLFKNPTALIGMVILLVLILLSLLAGVIAPYDPNEMDLTQMYASPSLKHLFGCDNLGRDCFSRILYGGRYSLAIGFATALFGFFVGAFLGLADGYIGGRFDTVFMRIMDIWSAIPGFLLAIIISVVLGGGFANTVLALSIGSVPGYVRLIRAQVLSIRRVEYLEAAKTINCHPLRIMFKHILPNVISPLIVSASMNVGMSIKEAASLSYIGLGIQPPTAEWGAMLSSGKDYVTLYPHLVLFPGLIIAITVLSVNMFGDGLRDAMDPKLKQ